MPSDPLSYKKVTKNPLITAAHGLHGQEKAGNLKHEQMDANEPRPEAT